MEYMVVTSGSPNEVWARGFYNETGKAKAEAMVAARYWHRFMYAADRHKTLTVCPCTNRARAS